MQVAGLHEECVTYPEAVLQLLARGEAHRHFGETKMNVKSSRSHTIFRMVHLVTRIILHPGCDVCIQAVMCSSGAPFLRYLPIGLPGCGESAAGGGFRGGPRCAGLPTHAGRPGRQRAAGQDRCASSVYDRTHLQFSGSMFWSAHDCGTAQQGQGPWYPTAHQALPDDQGPKECALRRAR